MRAPYWRDDHATLHLGDARDVLSEMPDRSVDCLVTSPPCYGLRDHCPEEYGQESTPDEYVDNLRATFAEARRVLADDGTCWLNLGDVYAAHSGGYARGVDYNQRQPVVRPRPRLVVPPKNLLGMPWRVAFALQQDGWILRNAIVWSKPNTMPQSVLDRLSTRYELIFLLVKQRFYWFDLDAIREQYTGDRSLSRRSRRGGMKPNAIQTPWPPVATPESASPLHGTGSRPNHRAIDAANSNGRNPGDVWTISTRPYRGAHFAPFPIDIPLRAIAAGCRPGGTVLDPFSGAATTALAARQLGRQFIGIELNAGYCKLAVARIREASAAAGGIE
ncbi:site-specific DNA-methyltransferase [Microbispora sp. SCL1-1]|uniref:DNA-methyltransferase n=1 Tax=unclassified Microbispora TaxID=2614687 RepID=UPI0011593230|nr:MULTISPECIES: site-specific DNA-methyltransferase [unclassified Microbispora]NJP27204.1 site-specific DNA-methyltransferase [Microbispora sp. CL1-1]TQS11538.1 site-specific DNA-methyltransferase [Microbispora sp. SCL1-1]